MKKTLIVVSLLALTTVLLTLTFTTDKVSAQKGRAIHIRPIAVEQAFQHVPGRLLVKFRSEIGSDHARQIIAALGTRDADEIPEIGVHVLELPNGANEMAFQRAFRGRPEVE